MTGVQTCALPISSRRRRGRRSGRRAGLGWMASSWNTVWRNHSATAFILLLSTASAPSFRPNVRHYYITCGNVRQEAAGEKLWDKIVPDAYCICRDRVLYLQRSAGVMELVDVVDSKSTAGDSVPVRVRSPAPNPYNPNLFPIGDGFGLFVFFDRYESTHFRNGVEWKPTSKPRGPRKK